MKAPPAPALKAVTADPKSTALLLLDFLPSYYCSDDPRCVASLPAMKSLLANARLHDVTVIYSVAGKFEAKDVLSDVAPIGPSRWSSPRLINSSIPISRKSSRRRIQTVIVAGTAANGAVLYTGSGRPCAA